MNKNVYRVTGLLAGLAVMVSVAGCTKATVGALQTETKNVALDGAKSAKVEISIDAGQLALTGGANNLMDAAFVYNVESWRPQVNYTVTGDKGVLRVDQLKSEEVFDISDGGARNEWTLKLNNDVPIDLTTSFGAGTTTLDLSDLALRSVDINGGAGDTVLNMAGDYTQDVTAKVHLGAGKTTIRLPREIGVRVDVSNGIGSVEAKGFDVSGQRYENDAYGKSDTNVTVTIENGIGDVILELADEAAR